MPIITNNNTQLLFGVGDISIQIGYKKLKSPGIVQFVEVDPKPIGTPIKLGTNEKVKMDEAPVTLIFNQIESIDVLINQLSKLREVMGGKRDARSIS
ncbi:hypothetical protein [Lysinibacillus irui]|uniref:hypothetical protein n=1 Tax=Lysinibacillus irui TaxID=2998077 RepID=UPI002AD51446|nr:hypothetical protein [Lysinibacillus irui]MEA0563491.1 hypothetical protein [Lysinibacillus irui]